jgi:hypothetical protein
VHLVGYFHNCITMHGFMNIKFISDIVVMLILLVGTIKIRARRYLECALLISRHQSFVSAHCTRWQLTQILKPVKQNIPRGATLVLTVSGRFKF